MTLTMNVDMNATFQEWAGTCLTSNDAAKKSLGLRSDATSFFSSLINYRNNKMDEGADVATDKPIQASALALLLSKLGPSLSSTRQSSKLMAISYIQGSLDAIAIPTSISDDKNSHADHQNLDRGLPCALIESIGKFLLNHAAPFVDDSSMSLENDQLVSPFEENNIIDDDGVTTEEVRDLSLDCICSLLLCPPSYSRHQKEKVHSVDDTNTNEIFEAKWSMEYVNLRIELAQSALEKRCANDVDYDKGDMEYNYDHGYEDDSPNINEGTTALLGLSMLARAKRSLCFKVLESAIRGITSDISLSGAQPSDDTDKVDIKIITRLQKFAIFVAECLHGESDPRCLLQMLRLIHLMQKTFFHPKLLQGKHFPSVAVFDAVAPYYPIQFKPKPNDPYGITREDLQHAILSILYHDHELSIPNASHIIKTNDFDQVEKNEENLAVLASRLFLEVISPPIADPYYEDYGDGSEGEASAKDRLESLEHLSCLLLEKIEPFGEVSFNAEGSSSYINKKIRKLSRLSNTMIKEISTTLIQCNEYASSIAITGSDVEEKLEGKALADGCRHLASSLAYWLELYHRLLIKEKKESKSLWETFVVEAIQEFIPTLESSPHSMKGRSIVAYLTALSACGGEFTLKFCLGKCIPCFLSSLVNVNSNISLHDVDGKTEEKVAASVYGIGALFSSSRVSMERITRNGAIVVSPHPLEEFGNKTIETLTSILFVTERNSDGETINGDLNDQSIIKNIDFRWGSHLRIAVIKAIEFVLQSSPFSTFDDKVVNLVREIVWKIAKQSLNGIDGVSVKGEGIQKNSEWKQACAKIVGLVIGRGLSDLTAIPSTDVNELTEKNMIQSCNQSQAIGGLLDFDPRIINFVKSSLFPYINGLCIDSEIINTTNRHDWMALAHSCKVGEKQASKIIVSKLLETLVLRIKNIDNYKEREGECPVLTNSYAVTCTLALSHVLRYGGPNPCIEFHSISAAKKTPMDVIHALANVYSQYYLGMFYFLPPETIDKNKQYEKSAIKFGHTIISHLLPAYQKSITIEHQNEIIDFASKVLPPVSNLDNIKLSLVLPILSKLLATGNEILNKTLLISMAPHLVEYCMSEKCNASMRSTSASCVFTIIADYQGNLGYCLARNLIRDKVSPDIQEFVCPRKGISRKGDIKRFEEALSLTALMGSAAACFSRGSAKTADDVARFLCLLLCNKTAAAPELGISANVTRFDSISHSFNMASILGSMFSVERANPFWRQRIAHKVLAIICPMDLKFSSPNSSSLAFNALVAVCHIANCVPPATLGQTKVNEIMTMILKALEMVISVNINKEKSFFEIWPTMILNRVIIMALCTLLKFMSHSIELVIPHFKSVVPTMILISAISHESCNVPCHLFAFQILMNIHDSSSYPEAQSICKVYKSKLMLHLGNCLDNSSFHVRQAAVHLRNIW